MTKKTMEYRKKLMAKLAAIRSGKVKVQMPKNDAEQVLFDIEYELELGKLTEREKFVMSMIHRYYRKNKYKITA